MKYVLSLVLSLLMILPTFAAKQQKVYPYFEKDIARLNQQKEQIDRSVYNVYANAYSYKLALESVIAQEKSQTKLRGKTRRAYKKELRRVDKLIKRLDKRGYTYTPRNRTFQFSKYETADQLISKRKMLLQNSLKQTQSKLSAYKVQRNQLLQKDKNRSNITKLQRDERKRIRAENKQVKKTQRVAKKYMKRAR